MGEDKGSGWPEVIIEPMKEICETSLKDLEGRDDNLNLIATANSLPRSLCTMEGAKGANYASILSQNPFPPIH